MFSHFHDIFLNIRIKTWIEKKNRMKENKEIMTTFMNLKKIVNITNY
jgi:HD superfamily phosphodiesterase